MAGADVDPFARPDQSELSACTQGQLVAYGGLPVKYSPSTQPHLQAPQRAWVTANHVPSRLRARSPRSPTPDLAKEYLLDGQALTIPRLLSIIEPRIVWRHPTSPVKLRQSKQSQPFYCAGNYFDAKQQTPECTRVHGVYEGSYWRLLADATDLKTALARLASAPQELPVPELSLPQQPADIPWESFAPALQPIEDTAPVPALVLPALQQPQLLVRCCQHLHFAHFWTCPLRSHTASSIDATPHCIATLTQQEAHASACTRHNSSSPHRLARTCLQAVVPECHRCIVHSSSLLDHSAKYRGLSSYRAPTIMTTATLFQVYPPHLSDARNARLCAGAPHTALG